MRHKMNRADCSEAQYTKKRPVYLKMYMNKTVKWRMNMCVSVWLNVSLKSTAWKADRATSRKLA